MAYASAADMLKRKDARTIGDLVSDTGVRINSTLLLTDANLSAALDDASGEIDAALRVANRYSAANLAGLTGNSLAHLKRICCDIAFGLLWERRPWGDEDQRADAMDRAKKALDRLRKGEAIFDIAANVEAGLPEAHVPSISSISRLNLLVDRARNGFYPARRLEDV